VTVHIPLASRATTGATVGGAGAGNAADGGRHLLPPLTDDPI